MTQRTYSVAFSVRLTIDEEAITRTQQDGWRQQMYDIDEDGAAAMLAHMLLFRDKVSDIDGWADMPDAKGHASVTDTLDVVRLT